MDAHHGPRPRRRRRQEAGGLLGWAHGWVAGPRRERGRSERALVLLPLEQGGGGHGRGRGGAVA